jgi:AraC-like DNA-binding protein
VRIVSEEIEIASHDVAGSFVLSFAIDRPSDDPVSRDDATMAVLWRMCQLIHGLGLVLEKVRFEHHAPADSSHYFSVFQCPVEFSARDNALVLPAEAADRPLSGANEQLARMNDHIVVQYLASRDKEDVVNRVRACILEGIADGRATEEGAAEALHTSTRHLNRKLGEQGTSFKRLLNEVRQELAEKYIADPTLSLTEISFLLGFSEASSFSRAFKRWTGQSPSEARTGATKE